MERRLEIRQPVVVGGYLMVGLVVWELGYHDFPEPLRLVVDDFIERGVKFLSSIPGPTGSIVEPRTELTGMRERPIHDVCVRNSVYQFVRSDPAEPPGLPNDAIIGHTVQQNHFLNCVLTAFDNVGKDGLLDTVERRDESMGSVTGIVLDRRCSQRPPRQASSMRRTPNMPGKPVLTIYSIGARPLNKAPRFPKVTH